MRKINLFLVALFTLISLQAVQAQDDPDYVTEDNLRKYALMQEVIDGMKAEISVMLNDMIKNQEGIDGKRYKELASGQGEPAKEYEQKFMDQLNGMIDDRKEAIKSVNQILATKLLPDGGKAYKAIQNAISSDEEVKARYEEIVAQIQLSEEEGA